VVNQIFAIFFINFHWFSLIFVISNDFHWFSWFSLIFIDFRVFSWISIDFRVFSLTKVLYNMKKTDSPINTKGPPLLSKNYVKCWNQHILVHFMHFSGNLETKYFKKFPIDEGLPPFRNPLKGRRPLKTPLLLF
jgi:hypothetical protein